MLMPSVQTRKERTHYGFSLSLFYIITTPQSLPQKRNSIILWTLSNRVSTTMQGISQEFHYWDTTYFHKSTPVLSQEYSSTFLRVLARNTANHSWCNDFKIISKQEYFQNNRFWSAKQAIWWCKTGYFETQNNRSTFWYKTKKGDSAFGTALIYETFNK